jgi:GNAT superfamily N-acetyltransferase
MPLDILRVVSFAPEMLADVRDFNYGDEPHQRELALWMVDDAVPALNRGTKVWLYVNEAGEVVGYGSLGTTRWKYPESDSAKRDLVIVPAVAIRKQYWGKPDGLQEERYSSQIVRHLVREAEGWPGQPPALGLFVHPDNHAAAKLYERFGFKPFSHTYADRATGVVYRSFIRFIVRA